MTIPAQPSCPRCGASIPDQAPQGLCPKCVLEEVAAATSSTTAPGRRTPSPTVEEVAAHFPDLEIVELIGAGGMGAVFKARQPKLDRLVALKILAHDLAADPAFAERFNREARVLARLNHPHIVTVFDFGNQGPFCFLLMEFVDGVNLRQAMRAGGFTPAESLALVQDVCAALKFAHEEGILHRDIKPENVLIDSRGRVKIADFGIAKLVGAGERDDFTLTVQGSVLGSPHYMAPEQIESPGDVDQRADIYSLGVVLYELLTGELPIGRFAPPSEKSPMDPRIDEIVMRALEKERQLRYQSAGEVQTSVDSITQSAPVAPRQPGGRPGAPSPATSGAAVAGATPANARFATASAILTGVSLLALGVAVIVVIGAQQMVESLTRKGPGVVPIFLPLVYVVCFLLVGVPALLGIIFGAKALGEIRQSGGHKAGVGGAMFGALTWPVLIVTALASMMLPLLLSTTGSGLSWQLLLALITAIAGPASLLLLVRRVGRWAQGSASGISARQVGNSVVAVFIACFLAILQYFLWSTPEPVTHRDSEARNRAIASAKAPVTPSSSKRRDGFEVTWHNMDPPDLRFDFEIPAGKTVTFALVRFNLLGDVVYSYDLNWSVVASDVEPFEGVIGIGKTVRELTPEGPLVDLRATIETLSGGPDSALQLGTTLLGNLSLPISLGSVQTLSEIGSKSREIGRFFPGPDPSKGGEESLALVLVTGERPGPTKPIILGESLIGQGDAAEIIDRWVEQQKQERP